MTLKETYVAQIYSKEEEGIKGMKEGYKIFVPEHLNFKKGFSSCNFRINTTSKGEVKRNWKW